jgi:hypothetical protein
VKDKYVESVIKNLDSVRYGCVNLKVVTSLSSHTSLANCPVMSVLSYVGHFPLPKYTDHIFKVRVQRNFPIGIFETST